MAKEKKYRLIFCSFSPVGLEDYVEYLRVHFSDFIYIKWKFAHIKGSQSECIRYNHGKEVSTNKLFSLPSFSNKFLYFLFLPLDYIVYFFQAIKISFSRANIPTIFMGINYFCTMCGIVSKMLGRVDFVIYRVMDFFPLPPSGIYRILNRIFYVIDKFCLDNCDELWFTTEGHIIGREKYGYFDRKNRSYSLIPLALDVKKFINVPLTKTSTYSLIYCGVVSRYHLLDLLFDAVLKLKKEFPKIKLNIIGSGPDVQYYKDLASKLDLSTNIIFYGYLDKDKKFDDLMTHNLLGIALYRDEENFMKYTEPAKVKYYLSYGVPALVSNVPKIAEEIHKNKVGFAISNDVEDIVSTIKTFIKSPNLQKTYKNNISKYVKNLDVTYLLDARFSELFKKLGSVK